MKIVILDAFGVDPGDMDWSELQALGDCTFHDRTPAHLVVKRARDAEIVITNKTVLSAAVIAKLPKCRYIGLLSTGMNAVDLEAARQRGIPVRNVPAYGTASVAQMVFAHILAHTNHVESHNAGVHEGRWARCPDFCYWTRRRTRRPDARHRRLRGHRPGRRPDRPRLWHAGRRPHALTGTGRGRPALRPARRSLPHGRHRLGLRRRLVAVAARNVREFLAQATVKQT